mmetsp:Transcript_32629/g.71090  ORF Transcript_32629/g.71090 Transcript_32629/m.71090 type:complete len:348 (+) Transcript_32629:741-1784(+)
MSALQLGHLLGEGGAVTQVFPSGIRREGHHQISEWPVRHLGQKDSQTDGDRHWGARHGPRDIGERDDVASCEVPCPIYRRLQSRCDRGIASSCFLGGLLVSCDSVSDHLENSLSHGVPLCVNHHAVHGGELGSVLLHLLDILMGIVLSALNLPVHESLNQVLATLHSVGVIGETVAGLVVSSLRPPTRLIGECSLVATQALTRDRGDVDLGVSMGAHLHLRDIQSSRESRHHLAIPLLGSGGGRSSGRHGCHLYHLFTIRPDHDSVLVVTGHLHHHISGRHHLPFRRGSISVFREHLVGNASHRVQSLVHVMALARGVLSGERKRRNCSSCSVLQKKSVILEELSCV